MLSDYGFQGLVSFLPHLLRQAARLCHLVTRMRIEKEWPTHDGEGGDEKGWQTTREQKWNRLGERMWLGGMKES